MQSMSIKKDTKRFYIKSFLFLSPRQRFRVAIFNFLIIIVFFVWFFSLLELFQSVLDHLSSLSSALLHFLECWSRHLKEQLRFVHSLIPHFSLLGFFPKFAIKVPSILGFSSMKLATYSCQVVSSLSQVVSCVLMAAWKIVFRSHKIVIKTFSYVMVLSPTS